MESTSDKDLIWTKEMLTKMLDALEQYPCLYDAKHNFYKNKHARRDALFQIAEHLKGELNLTVSSEQIKKKIANIRTQLSREIGKEISAKHSGMSADEREVDNIWWYERAQFVVPHVNPRKGKGTIRISQKRPHEEDEETQETQEITETQWTNEIFSDDEVSVPATPSTSSSIVPKKKVQKLEEDPITKKTVETLELLNRNLLANSNNSFNSLNIFGKFVAVELKQMADQGFIEDAKHEITNILYKYKKRSLEAATMIYEPVIDESL